MFSPDTKEELQYAVNLWCDNEEFALEKYRYINDWYVSNVEDMSWMFFMLKHLIKISHYGMYPMLKICLGCLHIQQILILILVVGMYPT